jgi:hypothetical protein
VHRKLKTATQHKLHKNPGVNSYAPAG